MIKYYTTCTNVETCSNITLNSIEYDFEIDPITICSICGEYAVNSYEPITNEAVNDEMFYLKNIVTLDQIVKHIKIYEKKKQGKNNEQNNEESSDFDKK